MTHDVRPNKNLKEIESIADDIKTICYDLQRNGNIISSSDDRQIGSIKDLIEIAYDLLSSVEEDVIYTESE